MALMAIKNPAWIHTGFLGTQMNYLFITYMVTSKPKRISVAAGLVHIMISFFISRTDPMSGSCECIIGLVSQNHAIADHERTLGNFMKWAS
ncbi:hypothetical protein ACJ67_10700 [Methylophilus sp. TWE2]|nr:hypothetical protein ACJ67_10700 [Methylophilus sp. TWE2]